MSTQKVIVKPNTYYDSVTLMSLGSKIKAETGAEDVVVLMATAMNKALLEGVELATEETRAANANDLIIAVRGQDEAACEKVTGLVWDRLLHGQEEQHSKAETICTTIEQAVGCLPAANLAVISVPGAFAAREARKALEQGLHVMMFSDNVAVEEERSLKEYAAAHGLLMMGPDCGTAMINGVALCFANVVRSGNIGVVAASGTGLQEIMVQIHRFGGGIYQAIGTGGRDLSQEIGGLMMLEGIKTLLADPSCSVLALVSKPPAPAVEAKIFSLLEQTQKPVVVCFLDGDTARVTKKEIRLHNNLLAAARDAVSLSGVMTATGAEDKLKEQVAGQVRAAAAALADSQQYLRGLFCGGTLCAEALSILRNRLDSGIRSNISHRPGEELRDGEAGGNILIDLGDDQYTNGRPHPMISPSLRNELIEAQGSDPSAGVLLLDFELGYGSHEDPAGEAAPSIRRAKQTAGDQGRSLAIVGYICGTEGDKQGLDAQRAKLENAGVILVGSNVEAAETAADILDRRVSHVN